MQQKKPISVLGIYVNDMSFVAPKLAKQGETVLGKEFRIGPGGKGTNQAIAISRAGMAVYLISTIGNDEYGKNAQTLLNKEKIHTKHINVSNDFQTGVAGIQIDEQGQNAIIVIPGAASHITINDIEKARKTIENSSVFISQLEAPVQCVEYALNIAFEKNVTTILNPAPAINIDKSILKKIDILTPNETEAASLSGIEIRNINDAKTAGKIILDFGVKFVVITLGEQGAIICSKKGFQHIESIEIANTIDTTGAGDAFNGALAVAIAEGYNIIRSVIFANTAAGISVTKSGTALSMPYRNEIESLLSGNDINE